jgi:hypothetical protein
LALLSAEERAYRVLERLARHGLRQFHLTGSLALATHRAAAGHCSPSRALNDIDIVVPSFTDVPDTLMRGFLVRHLHPKAPAGKMVAQLVDSDDVLRIDIFSAYGATLARSQVHTNAFGALPVVSVEDLAARNASLLMGLERGQEVARKHAEDFEWLAEFADPHGVEIAWRDHRKASDPPSFKEARERIRDLVKSGADLLVIPAYSQDAHAICPKCEEVGAWRLASGQEIIAVLGYC